MRGGPLLDGGWQRREDGLSPTVAVRSEATLSEASSPIELAAIDRGAGPAVALVHGGVFHSGPCWARTIGPLVEEGYRVIAVDRRGYGRSPDGDGDPVSV